MCSCEWNFRCERCREAPWQKYLEDGDEPTAQERAEAEAYRLWREQVGFGMVGRAW